MQHINTDLAMTGSGVTTDESVQVAGPLVPRRDTFRMYGGCRWLLTLHLNTCEYPEHV